MSKIVCDICGTTYPDTADCCPICGCSRESAMEFLGETLEAEELLDETSSKKGRYTTKKRKEIFDYDEVNPQVDATQTLDEEPEDEEKDEDEDGSGPSTGLIVGLTVLISVILLAVAFLFVRFILPSMKKDEPKSGTSVVQQTEAATEDMGNFIPCQYITLSSGGANLTAEGQYFLLHVVPTPEDTTDTIYYAIDDESVATVSEDGKITAVSEGETTVYITCGNQQITCPVTVKYEEETEPPTEMTEAPTEAEEIEETEAPEETKANTSLKNVTLKLKKTDIMLGVGYKVQLALDCDLDPTEVTWTVEHDHIASVDEEGWVKALKYGTTSVTAKYGDQEVKCMVRCG